MTHKSVVTARPVLFKLLKIIHEEKGRSMYRLTRNHTNWNLLLLTGKCGWAKITIFGWAMHVHLNANASPHLHCPSANARPPIYSNSVLWSVYIYICLPDGIVDTYILESWWSHINIYEPISISQRYCSTMAPERCTVQYNTHDTNTIDRHICIPKLHFCITNFYQGQILASRAQNTANMHFRVFRPFLSWYHAITKL